MSSRHGLDVPAGIDYVPHSRFHHGRFGRLFPNLDPAEYGTGEETRAGLEALADTMKDPLEPQPEGGWGGGEPSTANGDNPDVPAGYTYLGQFIDHDITFDPASSLLRSNDPDALHNFRTPRFDLDNVYGEGPDDEPFLFDLDTDKKKMLLEKREDPPDEFDLPRNDQGIALVGDPRNDENTIVSQLQVVFLRAHNKLVDLLGGNFDEARRQLRWHYQYIVIEDFLRRRIAPKATDSILPKGEPADWCNLCHCHFGHGLVFMPVEFSVAAYRFGHSMVRPQYDVNHVEGAETRDRPIFDKSGTREGGQDLRGFQRLLPKWGVDWSLFFEIGEGQAPQPSRLIDTKLADGLRVLPFADPPKNLAARNMQRGVVLGLPWGEAVAKRLGVDPLTPDEVGIDALQEVDTAFKEKLRGKTPLWYYVLREAEVREGGLQLGPVGGWIVAKTLICLLARDKFSYVNIDPNWKPDPELIPHEGDFEMADLIRFAIA